MSDPTPAPGWYPHNTKGGRDRYWDGSAWTDRVRATGTEGSDGSGTFMEKPAPPWGFIVFGVIVSVIGAILIVVGDSGAVLIGVVASVMGSSLVLVGCVAEGVRQGIRHGDYERRRRDGLQ